MTMSRITFLAASLAAAGATLVPAGGALAAGPAPVPAHVWVTTPDGQDKLSDLGTVTFGTAPVTAPTIVVDPTLTYQRMQGFGGAITDSSATVLYRLSPAARAATMRSLFDPGQYLQADFGRAIPARQVVVDTGTSTGDYPRGYTVTTSTDGVNWSTAVAAGQGTGQFTTIPLRGAPVRYLRVTLTASSASWWSVADVRAYTGGRP
jgi:hypothetical protein